VKNETGAFLLIVAVMLLSTSTKAQLEPPEPEPRAPVTTHVMEFDIADYVGEMGCLYIVRAEWVYLSQKSAEEKMEELRQ
jgi:hypothetical protein